MASSAHNPYGTTTTAPPPTPSAQPNPLSSSDAADVLSRLLHRLPPTLSRPARRSSPATASSPLISLSPRNPNLLSDLRSAALQHGFFQLIDHHVPSQLARAAESECLSLFNLTQEQKQIRFPKNWPLGFDWDDEEDENGTNQSFCLDSSCLTESTELSLASLGEFTREMEKVALEVVEALSCAVGFENPTRADPSRACSLMWISEGSPNNKPVTSDSGRFYPFVVGLQYQISCHKYSLLADSGWVSVSPHVDSVFVTLGDIAQVWSNGKIKKVRGRPVPSFGDGSSNNNSRCISMSLLVTLPVESTVSPLLPISTVDGDDKRVNEEEDDEGGSSADTGEDRWVFNSFSFEDYAWRVYHERILLKDPLDRYRV